MPSRRLSLTTLVSLVSSRCNLRPSNFAIRDAQQAEDHLLDEARSSRLGRRQIPYSADVLGGSRSIGMM